MVETAGVEPASESTFTVTSPCAAYRLKFPPRIAGKQAMRFSSFMVHGAGKAYCTHGRR